MRAISTRAPFAEIDWISNTPEPAARGELTVIRSPIASPSKKPLRSWSDWFSTVRSESFPYLIDPPTFLLNSPGPVMLIPVPYE